MTPIRHVFISPKSDGADSALVQPGDWNADHIGDEADASVNTTGATTTTLADIVLDVGMTTMIEARIVARRTGGALGAAEDGAGYTIIGTFKVVAALATQIDFISTLSEHRDQPTWVATFDVNLGSARIRVTGAAGNNISWHAFYRKWTTAD